MNYFDKVQTKLENQSESVEFTRGDWCVYKIFLGGFLFCTLTIKIFTIIRPTSASRMYNEMTNQYKSTRCLNLDT